MFLVIVTFPVPLHIHVYKPEMHVYKPVHDKTYNKLFDWQRLRSAYTYTQSGKGSGSSLFGQPGGCRRHMRSAKTLIKTARKRRLIWVFAGRTSLIAGFVYLPIIFCIIRLERIPETVDKRAAFKHTKLFLTSWTSLLRDVVYKYSRRHPEKCQNHEITKRRRYDEQTMTKQTSPIKHRRTNIEK